MSTLAFGFAGMQMASAVTDDGSGLLPNVDVRSEQKVPPVAPQELGRLEDRLGEDGFTATNPRTGSLAFVGRTDSLLTASSSAEPAEIVLGYVQSNRAAFGLDAQDLDALTLTESYTSGDGVTHLTFAQTSQGLQSFDTYLRGNVTKDGQLVNISGAPVPDLTVTSTNPVLSADQALLTARGNVGGADTVPEVRDRSTGPDRKTTYSTYAESARLVIFAQVGEDRLAWEVQVLDADGLLYRVVVDAATGDVLVRTSLTAFDSNTATVWNDFPSQTVTPLTVNFGTDGTWLDRSAANGNQLIGNNTHTYVDDNGFDGYQGGEQVVRNAGVDWRYPMTWYNQAGCPVAGCSWDSANPATKTVNRNAGAVGLFYLTNRFHDHLLKAPIGFTEASRNFEQVNSSGQGVGGDAVLAEAQDSSGTNNANFSTPADGSPGRMQMYLWDGTPGSAGPQYDVDGSAAADVVYHEYSHGLSNRLVGNGAGLSELQSRAMGEGWSDFYAIDFLVFSGTRADSAGPNLWLGGYATGVPGIFGGVSRIRHQAIDCPVGSASPNCPASGTAGAGGYTYGDLGEVGTINGVHDGGEIWSQTMWDLRKALGRTDALKVITGGMRLSPNAPSMLDMRNAILQSATVNGVDTDTVWEVFAARGMGYFASTPTANSNFAAEDFSTPPELLFQETKFNDDVPRGDGDNAAEPGETLAVTTKLKNVSGGAVRSFPGTLSSSLGTVTRASASWPALSNNASAVNAPAFAVTLPENAKCGAMATLTVSANGPTKPISIPALKVPLGKLAYTNSADVPKAIPDGNAGGVNSTFTLPGSGTVQNLTVRLGQITHSWAGDLRITLTHGATTVVLVNRIGPGVAGSSLDNVVNLILDDTATTPVDDATYGVTGYTGRYKPEAPLAAFNGHSFSGAWTLTVADMIAGDVGTLQQWGIGVRQCTTFGLPTSTSGDATAIGSGAATLTGTHNSGGHSTDYQFQWGTTAAYGQTTAITPGGTADAPVPVSAPLSGLAASTTYHFRLVALRDGVVISKGVDKVLTTALRPADPVPTGPSTPIETTPPTSIPTEPPAQVLDAVAPSLQITQGPKKKVKTRKAKAKVVVRFSSEPGALFTCQVDKASVKQCASPFSAKVAAKRGKGKRHTILIIARDAAGNASAPVAVTFKAVRRR